MHLNSRDIYVPELLGLLKQFHQSQMTRQCIFLTTELKPSQCMLKPSHQLLHLPQDSHDIYMSNKFDAYLARPRQLAQLSYPEFFRWWQKSTSEQRKGETLVSKRSVPSLEWLWAIPTCQHSCFVWSIVQSLYLWSKVWYNIIVTPAVFPQTFPFRNLFLKRNMQGYFNHWASTACKRRPSSAWIHLYTAYLHYLISHKHNVHSKT